jgi:hypothetical protein
MVYWAKRSCDPDAEIPFMKLVGDLQLKLGAPHELMILGSHPLTHKGYEVFIGVPQRELLALFDGFTEIQENELPDKLIALVIREDGFDERFPAIAAKLHSSLDSRGSVMSVSGKGSLPSSVSKSTKSLRR